MRHGAHLLQQLFSVAIEEVRGQQGQPHLHEVASQSADRVEQDFAQPAGMAAEQIPQRCRILFPGREPALGNFADNGDPLEPRRWIRRMVGGLYPPSSPAA
jgi:hypothetical protein